jgi:hypothetical protein
MRLEFLPLRTSVGSLVRILIRLIDESEIGDSLSSQHSMVNIGAKRSLISPGIECTDIVECGCVRCRVFLHEDAWNDAVFTALRTTTHIVVSGTIRRPFIDSLSRLSIHAEGRLAVDE